MTTITERIIKFNEGRLPEMLNLKYQAMAESAFRFYRATAHLFYEDLPATSFLFNTPRVWSCGDLHLANYGSYKGDNSLVYFDINDFDEATLAPALFDAARFITSLYVASESLEFDLKVTDELADIFVKTYAQTLSEGHVRYIEQDTAKTGIKKFMDKVAERKQKDLILSRIEMRKNEMRLKIDDVRTMKVPKEEYDIILEEVSNWLKQSESKTFGEVKDVAYRLAGTGSLGVERYAALIEAKDKKGDFFLLDIKEVRPSVVEHYIPSPQYPLFKNEAERVMAIQKRFQAIPQAMIQTASVRNKMFIIKELQPSNDKINFANFTGKSQKLADVLIVMAEILAWGQLRSSGRQGSSTTDTLMSFAQNREEWHIPLWIFHVNMPLRLKPILVTIHKLLRRIILRSFTWER